MFDFVTMIKVIQ